MEVKGSEKFKPSHLHISSNGFKFELTTTKFIINGCIINEFD
jgi:hypothetical protein